MKFLKILLSLAGFLVGTLQAAEESMPEGEVASGSAERWYQIELLIYKQKPTAATINEIWPQDISLSYPTPWVRLKTADEYIANPKPNPSLAVWLNRIQKSPFTPFVLQGDSSKTFVKAAKQIQRYEGDILFHGVWWQPFLQNDNQESPGILIKGGKSYGDHYELEGSVSFKLSRYLHIQTNLWLSEFVASTPEVAPGTDIVDWSPLLPLAPDLVLSQESEFTAPQSYRVQQIVTEKQSRRMRSEETHYIDHPKLGILVRLTPYSETPKP